MNKSFSFSIIRPGESLSFKFDISYFYFNNKSLKSEKLLFSLLLPSLFSSFFFISLKSPHITHLAPYYFLLFLSLSRLNTNMHKDYPETHSLNFTLNHMSMKISVFHTCLTTTFWFQATIIRHFFPCGWITSHLSPNLSFLQILLTIYSYIHKSHQGDCINGLFQLRNYRESP